MPGKLMSLRCRSRLGVAAPRLPGRGSQGGKGVLWLTAAREGQALPELMGYLSSGGLQVGVYPLCLAAQALVHYLQWLLGSVVTRHWSDHC